MTTLTPALGMSRGESYKRLNGRFITCFGRPHVTLKNLLVIWARHLKQTLHLGVGCVCVCVGEGAESLLKCETRLRYNLALFTFQDFLSSFLLSLPSCSPNTLQDSRTDLIKNSVITVVTNQWMGNKNCYWTFWSAMSYHHEMTHNCIIISMKYWTKHASLLCLFSFLI